jgi:hypothetical protein
MYISSFLYSEEGKIRWGPRYVPTNFTDRGSFREVSSRSAGH